ncbi:MULTISPECIES: hypothetical protein [Pseudomonas]|uniref:Uncharacterized protein n=1 Tax=Pseudomonas oryzihabitans TaxID=47885 RepID=A0A1G5PDD6_9PSED|nr:MULTISPECIES: hypothetical protein [Pseudomonas]NMY91536.1 hypothetical protein [Pseudomonas psychrotolerans]NMZ44567.1 hypothetical protein [Pseudomonas oryzihabitans]NMZ65493.1 hypothetical protein [Pseudomonas oryzihabitans]QEU04882.1 hypothetical protein FOB65_16720 [Pseudomonas oryzihabitans]RAU31330.1 hypothetical protein DBY63_023035 [Pseudomonas sp. RIT 411]
MSKDAIAHEYYETVTGRCWLDDVREWRRLQAEAQAAADRYLACPEDLEAPERLRLEQTWRTSNEEAGAFWQRMWSNLDRQ